MNRIALTAAALLAARVAGGAAEAEPEDVHAKLERLERSLATLEGRLLFPTVRALADLEILADMERAARAQRSAVEARKKAARAGLAQRAASYRKALPAEEAEELLTREALKTQRVCADCDASHRDLSSRIQALRGRQNVLVREIQRLEILQESGMPVPAAAPGVALLPIDLVFPSAAPSAKQVDEKPLTEAERKAARVFLDEVLREAREKEEEAPSKGE